MNGQLQLGLMPPHTGFRALGYFWLTIVMILAGGAGVLQYSYVPSEQGGPGNDDARGDAAGLDIMIASANSAAPSPLPRVEPARKLPKTFLAAATASDETDELPKVQAEPDPAEDPSAASDSAASAPEPVSEPDTVSDPAPIDEPAPADVPAQTTEPAPTSDPAPVSSPAPVSEPAPVAEPVHDPAPPPQMPAPASPLESAETKTAPAAPIPAVSPPSTSIPTVSTPTVSTPAVSPPDRAAEVRPAAPAPRAAAAPAVSSPAVSSIGNPALAEAMIRRADALLQRGDVSAARLLYERAAAAGSGRAATAMGKTFDPAFLAGIGAVGLSADPTLASTWYQRALRLGDDEARVRLQSLGSAPSRAATSNEARP